MMKPSVYLPDVVPALTRGKKQTNVPEKGKNTQLASYASPPMQTAGA